MKPHWRAIATWGKPEFEKRGEDAFHVRKVSDHWSLGSTVTGMSGTGSTGDSVGDHGGNLRLNGA